MKLLFVMDKFHAGNPSHGLSAWESNLFSSFANSCLGEADQFNFDSPNISDPYRTPADKLRTQVSDHAYDAVIIIHYRDVPQSSENDLSIDLLKYIRKNVPIVTAIYGDLEHISQINHYLRIRCYLDCAFYTAIAQIGARLSDPKLIYTWVPKDSRIFSENCRSQRDIDLLYIGSMKPPRKRLVSYLRDNGLQIVTTGGEQECALNVNSYADYLKRSKIALGFGRAAGHHVINARTFEALACGCMLLEQENIQTAFLFRRHMDYIPYYNFKDCLLKASTYLINTDLRLQVAESGQEWYRLHYTDRRFWEQFKSFVSTDGNKGALEANSSWVNLDLKPISISTSLPPLVRFKNSIAYHVVRTPYLCHVFPAIIRFSEIGRRLRQATQNSDKATNRLVKLVKDQGPLGLTRHIYNYLFG